MKPLLTKGDTIRTWSGRYALVLEVGEHLYGVWDATPSGKGLDRWWITQIDRELREGSWVLVGKNNPAENQKEKG